MQDSARPLIAAARALGGKVDALRFGPPVSHVYNPLSYAWPVHQAYLRLAPAGACPRRTVFVGMNPGPFGMVQTGVPFGEVRVVRDWMGIHAAVTQPPKLHPKRPILGFDCPRSEVSGRRLWGLFAARFGTARAFFREHFVLNYCPLAFFEEGGQNRTPDKLPVSEATPLEAVCDEHLRRAIEILQPAWVIGVGAFAAKRAAEALAGAPVRLGTILHPSPANPAANRDWAGAATRQLVTLGAWQP